MCFYRNPKAGKSSAFNNHDLRGRRSLGLHSCCTQQCLCFVTQWTSLEGWSVWKTWRKLLHEEEECWMCLLLQFFSIALMQFSQQECHSVLKKARAFRADSPVQKTLKQSKCFFPLTATLWRDGFIWDFTKAEMVKSNMILLKLCSMCQKQAKNMYTIWEHSTNDCIHWSLY